MKHCWLAVLFLLGSPTCATAADGTITATHAVTLDNGAIIRGTLIAEDSARIVLAIGNLGKVALTRDRIAGIRAEEAVIADAIAVELAEEAASKGDGSGNTPMHTAQFVTEATKAFPKDGIMIRDGGATVGEGRGVPVRRADPGWMLPASPLVKAVRSAAAAMGVPLLGRLPIRPEIARLGDGIPDQFLDLPTIDATRPP